MKILVVSDTHRSLDNFRKAVEKETPDRVIHCGDGQGKEDEMQNICGVPFDIVSGNCDFSFSLQPYLIINFDNLRIFVTHGHMHDVYYNTGTLVKTALGYECNVALYGHTHVPDIEYHGMLTVMNPGSLSEPRQVGRRPTYGIIETRENKDPLFEIRYV